MRVLLAFDKFKDALSAEAACEVAATALQAEHGDWQVDSCPLTDGGEGFARLLTRRAGGELRTSRVTGPRGEPVQAEWGLVALDRVPRGARGLLSLPAAQLRGAPLAVVEMAAASGLALVPPDARDPWTASSFGTGELLAAAAHAGAGAILLGVGGSATNDLGLGALFALGLRGEGAGLSPSRFPTPACWHGISRLQGRVRPLPPIRLACDVSHPLLGPRGCTAVFGPQKGLRPADTSALEAATARMARLLSGHFGAPPERADQPGAGAAGGIAFGLMTAVEARLIPGSDLVARWLSLDERILAADVVITGEGSFDRSSLEGKGAGSIRARARALGRPVHVFAGAIAPDLVGQPDLHALTPRDLPLADALPQTAERLRLAVAARFSGPAGFVHET